MKRLGAVLAAVMVAGGAVALAVVPKSPPPPSPPLTLTLPHSLEGLSGCGADASASLSSYFNNLPNNSSVTLPQNACFTVTSTVHISKTTGLTINGNGATFYNSTAETDSSKHEILFLQENIRLTIKNLSLQGSFTGSNGGPGREESAGVIAEANTTLTLNNVDITSVQGDFLQLQFPAAADVGSDGTQLLNSNVNVDNSAMTNAGYHGIVLESVGPTTRKGNGATFNHDTFANMTNTAIDAEYDDFSTVNPDSNGIGTYAAEDNVTFENSTFTNYAFVFFSSLQPQSNPGVQEKNITIINNKISTPQQAALVEILSSCFAGTSACSAQSQPSTTAPYIFNGFTMKNNTMTAPAYPVHGGAITSAPASSGSIEIQNVANVSITGNKFFFFDGLSNFFLNTPYIAVVQANEVNGLKVTNNSFSGAYEVLHPSSGSNTSTTQCGNTYWTSIAPRLDSSC